MKHTVNVQIKKLTDDAVIPFYSREGDVGLDLIATSRSFEDGAVVYGTGLAIEIPEGYYADLRARSSIAKYDLALANGVGTIDANYRGELILKFKPTQRIEEHHCRDVLIYDADSAEVETNIYKVGDKIAQLVIQPYPHVTFTLVDELAPSVRGESGFGSSGV